MLSCIGCGAPDYDPLSLEWARHIQANPGGFEGMSQKAFKASNKAYKLEQTAYQLYKKKQDQHAVKKYEAALKLYASGRLYFRFGNSLSNIRRFKDAIRAYRIATKLGYKRDGVVSYNTACALSRMGKTGEAYIALKKAVQDGYVAFRFMKSDPDLKNMWKTLSWKNVKKELDTIYKEKYLAVDKQLALEKAIMGGKLKYVKWVYKHNPGLKLPDGSRNSLFLHALTNNRMPLVHFMINNMLDLKKKSKAWGPTPPVIAAIHAGHPKIALLLFTKGVDPNTEGHHPDQLNTISVLQMASEKGQNEVVRYCLKKGVNPNIARDKAGTTAIARAAMNGHLDTVKLLLEAGADPNQSDYFGASAYQAALKNRALLKILTDWEAKSAKKDSIKRFRTLFLQEIANKKLTSNKKGYTMGGEVLNHSIIFTPEINFSETGMGKYAIYTTRTDSRKESLEETGNFRLNNASIRFLNRASYIINWRHSRFKIISKTRLSIGKTVYIIRK